jgi:hypothetical protein
VSVSGIVRMNLAGMETRTLRHLLEALRADGGTDALELLTAVKEELEARRA